MSLRSLIIRSVSQFNQKQRKSQYFQNSTLASPVASHASINVSEKVNAIVRLDNPMENALSSFVPYLNSKIVTYVIRQQEENLKLGFRFFLWTINWKRFRSWGSHNLVIDMITRENGVDLYWEVLDEVKSANRRIFPSAFAVLIEAYWKMKNAKKAVEAFGRMEEFDCKPDLLTYNIMLRILVKKEVVLLALAVYNTMMKINTSPNCTTFSILIDGMCKSGKIKDALQLFDDMKERGIKADNVINSVVLDGLCRAKKVDDAYHLFKSMKSTGSHMDSVTYNVMLNGVCKSGNMEQAFSLLKDFKKDGFVLNLNSYSNLIDGLCKARRIREAVELFHQMLVDNIKPDVIVYTIMIQGLCKVGMVKDAKNLFREMIERKIVPNTRCYNTLIQGCCDSGKLNQAKSLKEQMSKQNIIPNEYTYTFLIHGLCKEGRVDEAKQLFDEMEKFGCSPSVYSFNVLINGLCKAQKLEEARMCFYKMEIGRNTSLFFRLSHGQDRVLDSASLQEMVEKLCASNSVLKAYNLLTRLADSAVVPTIETYNTLIHGFCKEKNIDGALKIFKELQAKGLSPDNITYCTLIGGLQRVGRDEDSFSILQQMILKGYKPGPAIFNCLMTWSCRKGKVNLAYHIWLKYLRTLPGRDEEFFKSVESDLNNGKYEKATRKLIAMDFKLGQVADFSPYTIPLIGFCQIDKPHVALKVLNALDDHGVLVSGPSLVWLISSYCKKYDLDRAVNIFLYTLEKRILLGFAACNDLITRLVKSKGKQYPLIKIMKNMTSAGYDVEAILHPTTKALLRDYWNKRQFLCKRWKMQQFMREGLKKRLILGKHGKNQMILRKHGKNQMILRKHDKNQLIQLKHGKNQPKSIKKVSSS